MWRFLTRRLLFACIIVTCSSLFFLNRWAVTKHVIRAASHMFTKEPKFTGFLVETKECRIPNFDPFDTSISAFVRATLWEPCPGRKALTYQDGDVLRLNRSRIEYYHKDTFSICQYYPIIRDETDDNIYHVVKVGVHFNNDITVKHEFLKVICYDTDNDVIYTNYHAYVLHANIVQPKRFTKVDKIRQVMRKTSAKLETKAAWPTSTLSGESTVERTIPDVKIKMNVLLIGVDSMSRLNMMRQFSKTRSYLLDRLGAFDMTGYNKVADNTFVNLVPILAGKYVEDLPWNETLASKPFDNYEFIWKRYKEYGYATLFAEDAPHMTAFNYLKAGFQKKPTDHYYRAFALAMEGDQSVWSADSHCIHDRMETEMVLQYVYDFARVYKNEQFFGMTFISRLTHDDVNYAGRGDLLYLNFFKKLYENNLLKNTMVFFFSDHGIRFGKFRKTYIGKIEERLPFMVIIPPQWLVDRYPNVWGNLKVNSHRLTTPFDIHETLIDLLDIDTAAERVNKKMMDDGYSTTRKRVGYSLLSRVPYERTCDDASILTHWCSCHRLTKIDINDGKVIRVAEDMVKMINKKLQPVSKSCAVLKLNRILDAAIIGVNDQVLRFEDSVNDVIDRQVYFGKPAEVTSTDYQLTIETTPGLGHFEASIKYHPGKEKFTLLGFISRTNARGTQADCIDYEKFKLYCYCPQDNDR